MAAALGEDERLGLYVGLWEQIYRDWRDENEGRADLDELREAADAVWLSFALEDKTEVLHDYFVRRFPDGDNEEL